MRKVSLTASQRYEIRRGLLHAGARAKAREFEKFALASTIWPFDRATARLAADLCAALWRQGLLLDDADILIAATAMTNGLVLVTNDRRHFERIAGLEIVPGTGSRGEGRECQCARPTSRRG
ncbi:MAG: PIN domain-containing protein [Moorellales bacterium]